MAQYTCTLLLHADHGIISIYINSTHKTWHSTPVRYFYMQNMA